MKAIDRWDIIVQDNVRYSRSKSVKNLQEGGIVCNGVAKYYITCYSFSEFKERREAKCRSILSGR